MYSQVSTQNPPSQMVYVCPLCQAMQPVGSIPRYDDEGGRRSGSKECHQCGEPVAYGPVAGGYWVGGFLIVGGIVFAVISLAVAARKAASGGGVLICILASAFVLLLGLCACGRAVHLGALPHYTRSVWTPLADGGGGTAQLPSTSASAGAGGTAAQGGTATATAADKAQRSAADGKGSEEPPPPAYDSVV